MAAVVQNRHSEDLIALGRQKLEEFQKSRLNASSADSPSPTKTANFVPISPLKLFPPRSPDQTNSSPLTTSATVASPSPSVGGALTMNGVITPSSKSDKQLFDENLEFKTLLDTTLTELSLAQQSIAVSSLKISDQSSEINRLTNAVGCLTSEIDSCRIESDRLRSMNDKLCAQIEHQGEVLAGVRGDNARLLAEFEQLMREESASASNGSSTIMNSSVFASQVQEQAIRVERTLNKVLSQTQSHSPEMTELQRQVETLREIVDPVGMILGSSVASPSKPDFRDSAENSEELKELSQRISELQLEVQNKINSVQIMQKRVSEIKDEKEILTASLQQSLSEVSSDFAAQKEELRESRNALFEQKNRAQSLSEEKIKLENQLKERHLESLHLEEQLRSLDVDISDSEDDPVLSREKMKVKSLLEDKIFLAKQAEASQVEVDRLRGEISQLKQEFIRVSRKIDVRKRQNGPFSSSHVLSRQNDAASLSWIMSYFLSSDRPDLKPVVV